MCFKVGGGTAAEILAVKTVLLGENSRPVIAAVFFEVGSKPAETCFFGKSISQRIDDAGVFGGTYGKGGAEPGKAKLFGLQSGFAKPKLPAQETAFSSFREKMARYLYTVRT